MNANTQYMAKIAVNKSLLKEYYVNGKRTVYLNDGDDFQLQIFNKNSFTIGVEINFTGQTSSYNSRKLILKPGERVWLERYLDDSKKLCFKTYWVDSGDEQVDAAIASNGRITLSFYKEKIYETPNVTYLNGFSDNVLTYNYYNNNSITAGRASDLKYGINDVVGSSYSGDVKKYADANSTSRSMKKYKCNVDSNTVLGSCVNSLYASTLSFGPSAANASTTSYTAAASTASYESTSTDSYQQEEKETGRIEKGGYSSQGMRTVYCNLESYSFCTETIYLMPKSEKPITSKDLKKRYCPSCGRKIKEKFKFCPFCGGEL